MWRYKDLIPTYVLPLQIPCHAAILTTCARVNIRSQWTIEFLGAYILLYTRPCNNLAIYLLFRSTTGYIIMHNENITEMSGHDLGRGERMKRELFILR